MSDEDKVIRIGTDDGEPSYQFDLHRVHVDLFHLLSIVLADEKIAHVIEDEADPIWDLCSVAETEIARILVTSAVVARIADDQRGHVLLASPDPCGSLCEDTGSQATMPLTLREACNKIIHAKQLQLDIKHTTKELYSIMPTVYLLGEKNGKSWEAELDLVQYVRNFFCRTKVVDDEDTEQKDGQGR